MGVTFWDVAAVLVLVGMVDVVEWRGLEEVDREMKRLGDGDQVAQLNYVFNWLGIKRGPVLMLVYFVDVNNPSNDKTHSPYLNHILYSDFLITG